MTARQGSRPPSSAFRPVQRVPSSRSSVGLAEAITDETEQKGSVDEPGMLMSPGAIGSGGRRILH